MPEYLLKLYCYWPTWTKYMKTPHQRVSFSKTTKRDFLGSLVGKKVLTGAQCLQRSRGGGRSKVRANWEVRSHRASSAMARSRGSLVQYSWSQPRNQPVKVGGSKPCLILTMGVLRSLLAGSVSM